MRPQPRHAPLASGFKADNFVVAEYEGEVVAFGQLKPWVRDVPQKILDSGDAEKAARAAPNWEVRSVSPDPRCRLSS